LTASGPRASRATRSGRRRMWRASNDWRQRRQLRPPRHPSALRRSRMRPSTPLPPPRRPRPRRMTVPRLRRKARELVRLARRNMRAHAATQIAYAWLRPPSPCAWH
jgi:hypothetical protein